MEESMNFHDKVVLVAGGTGGLGREVTMAFLEAGAAVVTTYRRAEEFAALVSSAERIRATPPDGAAVDVTDATAGEQFVSGIVAKNRRLDNLVNTVRGYAGWIKPLEMGPRTY